MGLLWVSVVGDEFVAEEKHTINTGRGSHVFGGVLHSVATLAVEGEPVYSNTVFFGPAVPDKPVRVVRRLVGSGVFVVDLLQEGESGFGVVSQSVVATSDLEELQLSVSPVELKVFRPEGFDFSQWGSGSDILYYLTGSFRKDEALMWLRDHSMDVGVMATLADFSSIYLKQYTNQSGRTVALTSHFTSNRPVEKSYVKHTVEGTSNGVVFARLDQFDDEGNPACLTRGVFRLATGVHDVFPERSGAGASSVL